MSFLIAVLNHFFSLVYPLWKNAVKEILFRRSRILRCWFTKHLDSIILGSTGDTWALSFLLKSYNQNRRINLLLKALISLVKNLQCKFLTPLFGHVSYINSITNSNLKNALGGEFSTVRKYEPNRRVLKHHFSGFDRTSRCFIDSFHDQRLANIFLNRQFLPSLFCERKKFLINNKLHHLILHDKMKRNDREASVEGGIVLVDVTSISEMKKKSIVKMYHILLSHFLLPLLLY